MEDEVFNKVSYEIEDIVPRSDISDVEAWCEALAVIKRFSSTFKTEMEVREICRELTVKYKRFYDVDKDIFIQRSESMAADTLYLVLVIMRCIMLSDESCAPFPDLFDYISQLIYDANVYKDRFEEKRSDGDYCESYRYVKLDFEEQQDKPLIDAGDIVKIAIESNSVNLTSSVLEILRRIHENGGYYYKKEIMLLRDKLDEKNAENIAPKASTCSKEAMKDILTALTKARDKDGEKIFKKQLQWYAVFQVLKELEGYSENLAEFVRSMSDLGMDKVYPRCNYDSIKKVVLSASLRKTSVREWGGLKDGINEDDRKQIVVASELIKLLEA